MSDPSPAQRVRNLCDQISDTVEASDPASPIASYGGREGTPGSRIHTYPMSDDMLDARDALKALLVSWARLIMDEAETEFDGRDETTSIAAWIYRQADWLGSHPAVDDFLTEVTEAVQDLARIVDRGVSGRSFVGWDNGRPIFAEGARTYGTMESERLRNGRAALAVSVLDVDLPAKDCAEALRLHGHSVTARQILKLNEVDRRRRSAGKIGEYEGLSPVRVEETGKRVQPIFRVSEVLARLSGQRAG